jgi:hypothetical protein
MNYQVTGLIFFVMGSLSTCAAGSRELKAESTSPPAAAWATVPRGICIWKNQPFGEAEIAAVAKYSLVQTMIPSGIPWKPATGNIALEIKKHNPRATVIGYKNIVVHYDYHASPAIFREHPDWFLYDATGKPIMHNDKRPLHDLRTPAMRQWWVEDVHRLLNTPGFDGILIDAVAKVFFYRPITGALSEQGCADYAEGFHTLMRDTTNRCAGQGLLIGNCLRAVYADAGMAILRQYYDGSYLELFESPMRPPGKPAVPYENWVAKGIESVQQATAQGKLVFLTLSPGESAPNDIADLKAKAARGDRVDNGSVYRDREYKLAMFLICAGERTYLGYQYSRNAADDRRLWDPYFPEFHKPLGPPKGPATRTGFTYSREFEHASVSLDLRRRAGQIAWRTPGHLGSP